MSRQRQARRARVPVGRFLMKVQVPVLAIGPGGSTAASAFGERGDPTALLYNEDRGLYLETPLTEELRLMMGEDLRAFFWCEVAEGNVIFHERAPEQDW